MARTTFNIWQDKNKILLISIGGNKKTNRVVELTLVPRYITDNWSKIKGKETNSIRHGKLYVHALQNLIHFVCPSKCSHLINKTCYVQHNPRNAAQVVGILNGIVGKLELSELRMYLKIAKLQGVHNIRSMVAGDAALIPEKDWMVIENQIKSIYPIKDWLAYTHGWKTSPWLKSHVASVETREDAEQAKLAGWKVFETGSPTFDILPVAATLCPASTQFKHHRGYKITCTGCPIRCNGETGNHVIIPRHAQGDSSKQRSAAKKGITINDSKGRLRGRYAA